ncbi:MAG: XdhC family protein [Chloroflexi bacterium]|nr:XdhC family protein [Chloroflexota bacterium]MBI5828200.1 XdhC family protein [Chloroflexota bacterium]
MKSIFDSLSDLEKRGDTAALCTIVRERGSVPRHAGSRMLVHPDGHIEGSIGGGEMESRVIREALAALAEGTGRIVSYSLADPKSGDPGVCGGEVEIFVEPIKPLPTLLVIGGGHVGKALVHLGKWLGFRVALCDDRPDYCTPQWAPGADVYLPVPVSQLSSQFKFNDQTCIVMPTRGVGLDVDALPLLLDLPHAYLGVIGSRRRWVTARKRLEDGGIAKDKLDAVHAPMGLELNAETPEQIALSIMAEIVMLQRGGDGKPMMLTIQGEA